MKTVCLLFVLAFTAFEAAAQAGMTLILNKEGKIIAIPRRKTYELRIPAYSYGSYTPASRMATEMKLREFTPEAPPETPDELPMNMQTLSEAYRPFFNVYTPMLRRVAPFALDFSETSVVPLAGNWALHPIQCYERGSFRQGFYDNNVAGYLIRIKTVQRLAERIQYIVCNIYHIIDGAQTDGTQFILQPARTLPYRHSLHRNAGITQTSLPVLYDYTDVPFMVINSKVVRSGFAQRRFVSVLHEIGVQVTGNPVV